MHVVEVAVGGRKPVGKRRERTGGDGGDGGIDGGSDAERPRWRPVGDRRRPTTSLDGMARGDRRRVSGSIAISAALVAGAAVFAGSALRDRPEPVDAAVEIVPVLELPEPRIQGETSFEAALLQRRAIRDFTPEALSPAQLGQLLWAAQGESGDGRNAPSAGALYPLEVYVAHQDGIFHYRPGDHEVALTSAEDIREELAAAALDQRAFHTAPAVIAIAGVTERTAAKYGDRAEQYVLIEVGHAGQNVLMQAAVLGLGAVPTGAFDDDDVAALFEMPAGTRPLYLIPVGTPA
ncbi:MAG: SagB/ThcOx family dehydrogenase [Actinomycetota bacterium]